MGNLKEKTKVSNIKKIIELGLSLSIAVYFCMPVSSFASLNDPWWLLFQVKGSQVMSKKGPYKTKAECEMNRIGLNKDQVFKGCIQYLLAKK